MSPPVFVVDTNVVVAGVITGSIHSHAAAVPDALSSPSSSHQANSATRSALASRRAWRAAPERRVTLR